jgi:hypothetical protein
LRINQFLLLKPREMRSTGPLNIFGDLVFVKLGGDYTDGNYAIMETVTPPQGGPPLHRHRREDESFYVLDGEYVFEVDGEGASRGLRLLDLRTTGHCSHTSEYRQQSRPHACNRATRWPRCLLQ